MAKRVGEDGALTNLGWKPPLKELQAAVGGYVELVRTGNPRVIALVDEDGHGNRRPLNTVGSALVGQPLVGPVVLLDYFEMD